jgi:transcriptional regulator with XRE-family HTH domain
MSEEGQKFQFDNAFCARVQELREGKGWVAEQMATALGIPVDRYRKYETRSPMPHYLIPQFAQVVDRSIEYVMTGKETKRVGQIGEQRKKSNGY